MMPGTAMPGDDVLVEVHELIFVLDQGWIWIVNLAESI